MTGEFDVSTIAQLLQSQFEHRPGAVALFAPGRVPATYADLHMLALHCANALQAVGFGPGARIAVALPNGPEAAAAAVAVSACATCAPLDPGHPADEARFHLEEKRADAVIVCRRQRAPVREVAAELGMAVFELAADPARPAGIFDLRCLRRGVRVRPDAAPVADEIWPEARDYALILNTHGATTRSRIVALSQANLVASARDIATQLGLAPGTRGLNVMPLFHFHGLVGSLLSTLAAGGSVVCTPGFTGDTFFDWIGEFDPSWYTATPAIHQAILANAAAYRRRALLHSFRFVRSSSAPLPPTTLAQLESVFGAPVIDAYGTVCASGLDEMPIEHGDVAVAGAYTVPRASIGESSVRAARAA